MVFKPTFSLENLMKYTCMKSWHKDHYIIKGIMKKNLKKSFGRIYLTHT